MNYYNRHIGDYARDTSHLSFAEDGAYNRMLDYYYATEAPLPLDRAILYRRVRARSKAERGMIDRLLTEFFTETADGWRKGRCDEEIAKAIENGEESAAKRENEKERQRRHRERRKTLFDKLRECDIVPKFDTPTEELQRLLDTHLSRDSHALVTRTATAIHKPIANNQEPKERSNPIARGDKSPSHVSAVNGEAVAFIPLAGGKEFGVSKALLAELEAAYPMVDGPQTLKEIRAWCITNPTRCKTERGAPRFLNRWFEQVQNRG